MNFIGWLSIEENAKYRLLTEAEWEYCCRAGSSSLYSFGNNSTDLVKYGNVLDRTGWQTFKSDTRMADSSQNELINATDGKVFTASVGSFAPNAFGLFDFHGNVCEWCYDWYGEDYTKSSSLDPQGAPVGAQRCARGGRFDTGQRLAMSFTRNYGVPLMTDMILGFRILKEVSE